MFKNKALRLFQGGGEKLCRFARELGCQFPKSPDSPVPRNYNELGPVVTSIHPSTVGKEIKQKP